MPVVDEATAREALKDYAKEESIPQWKRLVANFPIAGLRFVEAVETSKQLSELSPELQAKINWVVARQDRAWYNVANCAKELQAHKVPADEMLALDQIYQCLIEPIGSRPSIAETGQESCFISNRINNKEVAEAVQATSAKAARKRFITRPCEPC